MAELVRVSSFELENHLFYTAREAAQVIAR